MFNCETHLPLSGEATGTLCPMRWPHTISTWRTDGICTEGCVRGFPSTMRSLHPEENCLNGSWSLPNLHAVCITGHHHASLWFTAGDFFVAPKLVTKKTFTLPKTNIAPENRASQKETLVFQPSIFRCYVSFREGKSPLHVPNKRSTSTTSFLRSVPSFLMVRRAKCHCWFGGRVFLHPNEQWLNMENMTSWWLDKIKSKSIKTQEIPNYPSFIWRSVGTSKQQNSVLLL